MKCLNILPPKYQQYFDLLPKEFSRAEASKLGVDLGKSPRTFEIYLRKKSFSDKFVKLYQGQYRKL